MLSLTHVTKLYGSVIGVNDVTVELGAGAHGLLGPNGAGKTTFLGLVTGQLRPTMGQVRVFGERPFANPRVLRRIGYCPATDLLERRATPREWVTYLVRLTGHSPREAAALAVEALDHVGLGEAIDRPLATLSKGMRQRAKLAGAMAHDPDLLVLDEPFDGLDPVARHDLVTLVQRWSEAAGRPNGGRRTLLVASHLLHEVEALHAGLAVILGGRLVASGTAAEIRDMVDAMPSEVRIRCAAPRRLAESLCGSPGAESVRFEGEDAVVVATRQPRALAEWITRAAGEPGIAITEVASADRSLEGIFGRLVRLHRGVGG
ncbi:MAG: putative transporter ATP-binding protein YxlF [Planctomycetota bacterium]|jgi:ABC-2 type transport system ATP-binding protein